MHMPRAALLMFQAKNLAIGILPKRLTAPSPPPPATPRAIARSTQMATPLVVFLCQEAAKIS